MSKIFTRLDLWPDELNLIRACLERENDVALDEDEAYPTELNDTLQRTREKIRAAISRL